MEWLERLLNENAILALLAIIAGPAGAVWAVFKFKLNGLAEDLREHMTSSKAHRAAVWKACRSLEAEARDTQEEVRLLAQRLLVICPYWEGQREDRLPHPKNPKP